MALTSSLTEKRKKYFTNAGYGTPAASGSAQSWKDRLSSLYDQISNRKFTYNQSEDPLAQQYQQMYRKNSQMAMKDTMGNASALSGGYANSYAQTAGQAMYNQNMAQMNERALELSQLAQNRYQAETESLNSQLANAANMYAQQYQEGRDAVADSQWQQKFNEENRVNDRNFLENQRQFNASEASNLLKSGYNADGTVNRNSLQYLDYLADKQNKKDTLNYNYLMNGYNPDGTVNRNSLAYKQYLDSKAKSASNDKALALDAAAKGMEYDTTTGTYKQTKEAAEKEQAALNAAAVQNQIDQDNAKIKAGMIPTGFNSDGTVSGWENKQTEGEKVSDKKYRTERTVESVEPDIKNLNLSKNFLNRKDDNGNKKTNTKWIEKQMETLNKFGNDYQRYEYIKSLKADYNISEYLFEALCNAYGLS